MQVGEEDGAAGVHVLAGLDAHGGRGSHAGNRGHPRELLRDPDDDRNVVDGA